jgi:proteasome lid subunit RPN8/RPN11
MAELTAESGGELDAAPARLRLAPELRAALERWSRAAYPLEACGVLLGRRAGAELAIEDVTLARNLLAESAPSAATHAFDLHPADLVLAEDRARAAGREVVGIWHSHPDGPAIPSAEDRRLWNGWFQILVGVDRASVRRLSAWWNGRVEVDLPR